MDRNVKIAKQLVKIAKELVSTDESILVDVHIKKNDYTHLGDDASYIAADYNGGDAQLVKSDAEKIKEDLNSCIGSNEWQFENIFKGFSIAVFDENKVQTALDCIKQTLKKLGRNII